MKLTESQEFHLLTCKKFGSLELGGLDKTPDIFTSVVNTLVRKGYLMVKPYHWAHGLYSPVKAYILTEMGKDYLAQQAKEHGENLCTNIGNQ